MQNLSENKGHDSLSSSFVVLRRCSLCGEPLPLNQFLSREDAPGYYAWCKNCMEKERRDAAHPDVKERGHGVYRVNLGSLRKDYVVPTA